MILRVTEACGTIAALALLGASGWRPKNSLDWVAGVIPVVAWPVTVAIFAAGIVRSAARFLRRRRYRVTANGERRRIVSGPVTTRWEPVMDPRSRHPRDDVQ